MKTIEKLNLIEIIIGEEIENKEVVADMIPTGIEDDSVVQFIEQIAGSNFDDNGVDPFSGVQEYSIETDSYIVEINITDEIDIDITEK